MNAAQPIQIDVVTLEMAGALEKWHVVPDGAIHILLRIGVMCRVCKVEHAWYVNRDGRTRCVECDEYFQRTGQERPLVYGATRSGRVEFTR